MRRTSRAKRRRTRSKRAVPWAFLVPLVYGGAATWTAYSYSAAEASGNAGYLVSAALLILSLPFNYVVGPVTVAAGWELEFEMQVFLCMALNFTSLLLWAIVRTRRALRDPQ